MQAPIKRETFTNMELVGVFRLDVGNRVLYDRCVFGGGDDCDEERQNNIYQGLEL